MVPGPWSLVPCQLSNSKCKTTLYPCHQQALGWPGGDGRRRNKGFGGSSVTSSPMKPTTKGRADRQRAPNWENPWLFPEALGLLGHWVCWKRGVNRERQREKLEEDDDGETRRRGPVGGSQGGQLVSTPSTPAPAPAPTPTHTQTLSVLSASFVCPRESSRRTH